MPRAKLSALLLSTSLEGGGGASASKLREGLTRAGVETRILVRSGADSPGVVALPQRRSVRLYRKILRLFGSSSLEELPLRLGRYRPTTPFSVDWVPELVAKKVRELKPDVANLHFVSGLVRIESLRKLGIPIVWTLCDSWPFTGGCFLPQDCTRFMEKCGSCPQLASKKDNDLSRRVWQRKAKAWKAIDLTVVSPSRETAERARQSSLFRDKSIEVIPTGVDTETYFPRPREHVRRALGLPVQSKIVLFSAWHNVPNKGLHFLLDALKRLLASGWSIPVELVVLGFNEPDPFPQLGLRCRFLGKLGDHLSKSLVYSAADVLVAPSMQDNFPNVVLEALACGTPCLAFRIGGMPDLIDHRENGYLASPFQVDDLANGLHWLLEDEERLLSLSRSARAKVEAEYTLAAYGRRYRELFQRLSTSRSAVSRQP